MKKVLIIEDLNGWFWATFPDWHASPVSLDVDSMARHLHAVGFDVEITSYMDFDPTRDYKGWYVLYGSAEDIGGGSKTYIEDIITWLDVCGAILMPRFTLFRAHDNKVMMELMKKTFKNENLREPATKLYPSLEELEKDKKERTYPVVIKASRGAGDASVFLAENKKELLSQAKKVSRTLDKSKFVFFTALNVQQRMLHRESIPTHNTKFIVQGFIKHLSGDFKVLVFANQYYVLHRLNRENDFRASGSGNFTDDNGKELPKVLDFAKACKEELDSPFLSLDIAWGGSRCYLIEYQGITFGFKAMRLSKLHYEWDEANSTWETVEGEVVPEEVFINAFLSYIPKPQENKSREES